MPIEAETASFLESGISSEHGFRILWSDGTTLVLRGLKVDVTRQGFAQSADQAVTMNATSEIGFCEYDITHSRSWWSAEMFSLLKLEPSGALDLEVVNRARVFEEDRERPRVLQAAANDRLGRYEIEYRVRRDGASLADLRKRLRSHRSEARDAGRVGGAWKLFG